jgi:transposase-like protein
MARAAKTSRKASSTAAPTPAPATRKRLTPEQKAAIAQGLANGQTGATLAAQFGVSLATIYQQKKKLAAVATSSASATVGVTALQKRLILWASRKLLGRPVDESETAELKRILEAEVQRRFEEGLTG